MIQGKGGTQEQQTQSVFGDYGPQSTQEQAIVADIDTGSGYYRNPYSSGYGMGYQDPYAGMRYMPQRGLMGGPSGFGGKGGYSQPMSSPYGLPPYGGMRPSKGGYMSPRERASMPPSGYTEANPDLTTVQEPYYADAPVEVPSVMDIADAVPTQTMPVGTVDESSIADFTPYAGEELVRIGDQVVSRADLQRRGSDYYTRPIQEPPMQMYPMMRRQQYPMYGGKGGYYR